MSIAGGVAGKRKGKPLGIFWHNDAGSINATAKYWEHFYQMQRKGSYPFAHYYCDKDNIVQVEDDEYGAWHCGSSENMTYLSLEVCQSMGADDKTFLANEEQAIKLTAKLFKKYGIEPNEKTVRLHQEVFKTACPHRSIELHGGTVESCKKYLIDRIKNYIRKERGAEEMECFITKGNTIYYCNVGAGQLFAIPTSNAYKVMRDTYFKNNGKELVHYVSTDNAKYYETFKGIIKASKNV